MDRFKIISKEKLNDLPQTAGVYSFYDKKELIYVGKAINIKNRVKNHFNGNYWWEKTLLRPASAKASAGKQGFAGRIGFIKTDSEIEALVLEANLIKKYQPKFNVVWRDDKNYFYVAIEQNEQKIPYIYITHQPKAKSYKLKADYVGPFVEGTALKKTLRYLRRVFPYYTTKKHPRVKCTYCHLGLCPGPELFENPPSPEALADLREYEKNIKKLILILKGKRNNVLSSLKKEMRESSAQNKFEDAGKIRDRIYNLQQIMSHTKVINNEQLTSNGWLKNEKILQGLLNLKEVSRIECYDVSNIQGKFATASMVVFVNGAADKRLYKKFKIKMKNEPNDIAMLKETLERRFAHSEWRYPEIILIDGGIAQLNVAVKVKNETLRHGSGQKKNIKIISIAKRNKDLYIEGRKDFVPLKSLPREIYNLVLQLDDEAHRFAINYHKKLRKKSLLH